VILVVDDHRDTSSLLIRLLAKRGYSASWVGSGEAALAAMATSRPRLIVLDYMMPGMSGLDVLRHVRSQPSLATVSVVMFSAAPHDGNVRAEALRLGAIDWISKDASRGWETLLKVVGRAAEPGDT
jgi:DNA-binding response OmpR family regulator